MATKIIKEESSAGAVAIIAVLVILLAAFFLYNQGYFSNDTTEINVTLPNGQSISGSVRE